MDLIKVMILIFSKLEQQWLYHWETTTNIDGGGGTTDAALFHLEDQLCAQTSELHPKIIDYFDIIINTEIRVLLSPHCHRRQQLWLASLHHHRRQPFHSIG